MSRPARERGAALLAVLLLVAVTGALAVAALEKLRLSTAAAINAAAFDQARFFAGGMEQLALLAIERRLAERPDRTLSAGGWNGAVRRVPLPEGGIAEIRVRDGGNCFNLNSLVEGDSGRGHSRRRSGIDQFATLMSLIGHPAGEARRIAEQASDRALGALYADVSELREVPGIGPEAYARLRPWLCALPSAELSPINVNTLAPGQAALLAMIAPGALPLERARALLSGRPEEGWGDHSAIWGPDRAGRAAVPLDVRHQPQFRTRWLVLDTRVELEGAEFLQSSLVDARLQPARIAARRWGEEE